MKLDVTCGAFYFLPHLSAHGHHASVGRVARHTTKKNSKKRSRKGAMMWDTCAVELKVHLPRPVAAEIEEVQRRDPDMLSRMLFYAMTRRTIFDQLSARAGQLPKSGSSGASS